jgi:hypothetical protein
VAVAAASFILLTALKTEGFEGRSGKDENHAAPPRSGAGRGDLNARPNPACAIPKSSSGSAPAVDASRPEFPAFENARAQQEAEKNISARTLKLIDFQTKRLENLAGEVAKKGDAERARLMRVRIKNLLDRKKALQAEDTDTN